MKKIVNDLFNITKRIKNIDNGYFVVFNFYNKKYEIHNKKQKGGTFAFSVDKNLNSEVLTKAYKTHIRNFKKVFAEIEKNNDDIWYREENLIKEKNLQKFKSFLTFADNQHKNCNFESYDKTRWV